VHCPPAGGSSTICFPVTEGSSVTGLLEIELTDSMSAREARLVEGILRILRNQTVLIDYGERDTLTGLLNRKTFESRFGKICGELQDAASLPSQPRSWFGLLDIDRCKSINDTYGHVMRSACMAFGPISRRRRFASDCAGGESAAMAWWSESLRSDGYSESTRRFERPLQSGL
jgi:Diguanylate cyclase, GGDEF domain